MGRLLGGSGEVAGIEEGSEVGVVTIVVGGMDESVEEGPARESEVRFGMRVEGGPEEGAGEDPVGESEARSEIGGEDAATEVGADEGPGVELEVGVG